MIGQRLSTIAHILGCKIQSVNYIEHLNDKYIEHFDFDSRKLTPNSLFFALKGEKTDGHQFLQEAAQKKVAGAIVSKEFKGEEFGLHLIRVDDVLKSLHQLAKEALSQRELSIIGVTGFVGKTTSKEFIATLLQGKFKVGKTVGNSNSQAGMPTSILNLEGGKEVLVVEMGMSYPGEIERLVDIAPPDMVLISRIAFSHAENFPDGLAGIAQAKGEILSHPKTRLAIVSICGKMILRRYMPPGINY